MTFDVFDRASQIAELSLTMKINTDAVVVTMNECMMEVLRIEESKIKNYAGGDFGTTDTEFYEACTARDLLTLSIPDNLQIVWRLQIERIRKKLDQTVLRDFDPSILTPLTPNLRIVLPGKIIQTVISEASRLSIPGSSISLTIRNEAQIIIESSIGFSISSWYKKCFPSSPPPSVT